MPTLQAIGRSGWQLLARVRRPLYQLGLVLGLGLLGLQAVSAVGRLLQTGLVLTQPLALVGAFLVCLMSTALPMMAWATIIRDLGTTLSWREVAQGYLLAFAPRYIPGSIWGYLSRNEWLYRQFGTPASAANFSSVLEVCLSLASSAAYIAAFYASDNAAARFWLLSLGLLALALGLLWRMGYLVVGLSRKALGTELRPVSLQAWARSGLIFGGHWLLNGVTLWLVTHSLADSNLAALSLESSIRLYALAWVSGFLVLFVPAGLGVRESMLALLLVADYGIPSGTASLMSLVLRLVAISAEVSWLALGFALRQRPSS